jgi:hypothetical protein
MAPNATLQFQAGGALEWDAFYIERAADAVLYEALSRGEICYILGPRQIGKSSLRMRAKKRLEAGGARCASIDLNRIQTTEITLLAWYRSVAERIARDLGAHEGFKRFWNGSDAGPVERFELFLRQFLLETVPGTIVVFIDEIDTIRQLPFDTDDFFASIRALFDDREAHPALRRLALCFLGVGLHRDLIADPDRTPFNRATEVRLFDFTRDELTPLEPGLRASGGDSTRLLDEVFTWTSGHPYLTQVLCLDLSRQGPSDTSEADRVESLVRQRFLARGAETNVNLENALKRFESRALLPAMVELYKRVRNGERVDASGGDTAIGELRMTGMVMDVFDGERWLLRVRNKTYAEIFDEAWIWEHEQRRPIAEHIRSWEKAGRHADYLLRGRALERAREWAKGRKDLTPLENEFLRDAEALAAGLRQSALRRRALTALVTVSLLALSWVLGVAWMAEREKRRIEAAAAEARRRLQGDNDELTRQVDEKKKALEDAKENIEQRRQNIRQLEQQAQVLISHVDKAKEDAAAAEESAKSSEARNRAAQASAAKAKKERDDALREAEKVLGDRRDLEDLRRRVKELEQDLSACRGGSPSQGSKPKW